jgi:hypothetical protein
MGRPGGVREVRVVYRYEIEARPAALGGGIRLYLYGPDQETGEEIELARLAALLLKANIKRS